MRIHARLVPLCVVAAASLPTSVFAQGLIGGPPTHPGQNWPSIAAPEGNPFESSTTDPFTPAPGSNTELRARLGKALFWDEQVSTDSTMACGTCHQPAVGGVDPRMAVPAPSGKNGAPGMVPQTFSNAYRADVDLVDMRRVTDLSAPTMIGAAFFDQLFWELRAGPAFSPEEGGDAFDGFSGAAALEALSVEPPISSVEMSHDLLTWGSGELQAKLGAARPLRLATPSSVPADIAHLTTPGVTYGSLFDDVFMDHPTFGGAVGVTRERFALALATYQRTLVPNQAPIDSGLTEEDAITGFGHMLNSGCFSCHSFTGFPQLSPTGGFQEPFDNLLSDGQLHQIGAPPPNGLLSVKTPSLRNSALKSNLYHNGSLNSIEDAIDFLNGEHPTQSAVGFAPQLSAEEKLEVLAFFDALVDPRVADEAFPFDRPDLYSERVPFDANVYGVGTPAEGQEEPPRIVANSPLIEAAPADPSVLNKVGLYGTLPHELSVLHVSLAPANGPLAYIDTGPDHYVGHAFVKAGEDGVATYVYPANPVGLAGTTFYVQWATLENPSISRAASMLMH